MKALFFLFTLFGSWLSLMGGLVAKNPFPNFAACIIIWLIYYLLTAPGRRRKQYQRQRRQLQDEYMRAFIRHHKF